MFFKVIKDVYNTVIPPWGEIFYHHHTHNEFM